MRNELITHMECHRKPACHVRNNSKKRSRRDGWCGHCLKGLTKATGSATRGKTGSVRRVARVRCAALRGPIEALREGWRRPGLRPPEAAAAMGSPSLSASSRSHFCFDSRVYAGLFREESTSWGKCSRRRRPKTAGQLEARETGVEPTGRDDARYVWRGPRTRRIAHARWVQLQTAAPGGSQYGGRAQN